jgi:hypothetical protein
LISENFDVSGYRVRESVDVHMHERQHTIKDFQRGGAGPEEPAVQNRDPELQDLL